MWLATRASWGSTRLAPPARSANTANIWKLVDGFPVAWNIYLERYNKARNLVYEPARKMFPAREPAK
jgi:hypothetical protein